MQKSVPKHARKMFKYHLTGFMDYMYTHCKSNDNTRAEFLRQLPCSNEVMLHSFDKREE